MACRYKNMCPSYSGWCEGPKQDFARCIPFLVTAYENIKKGMLKMEDWITKSEPIFRYMMLDRMKQDCEYYLRTGDRGKDELLGGDEKRHIECMKAIWNGFPEEDKPEWLSMEDILEYEKKMCV